MLLSTLIQVIHRSSLLEWCIRFCSIGNTLMQPSYVKLMRTPVSTVRACVSVSRCAFSPPQCVSSWLTKHSTEKGLTSIPLYPSIPPPPAPLTSASLVYCAAERSGGQTSPGCDLIKGRRVNVMNSQPITLIWAHLTCLQGTRDGLTARERGRRGSSREGRMRCGGDQGEGGKPFP